MKSLAEEVLNLLQDAKARNLSKAQFLSCLEDEVAFGSSPSGKACAPHLAEAASLILGEFTK